MSGLSAVRRRRRRALSFVLPVLAAVLLPAAAHASWPGLNGWESFSSNRFDTPISGDIFVMPPIGLPQAQLTTARPDDAQSAWSPDGRRIAFKSRRNGDNELYVMNADGTGQTRLTNDTHQDNEPAWAPDGTRIAWVSNRMIAFNIWTMKPDGTGLVQLTSMKQPEVDPAWSPDSSKILFSSNRAGVGTSFDLFTMNSTNGSSVVRITSAANDDTEPAYSRDGRKIVFMSTRLSTSNADIFVANPDGSGATRVTTYSGADRNPDW